MERAHFFHREIEMSKDTISKDSSLLQVNSLLTLNNLSYSNS